MSVAAKICGLRDPRHAVLAAAHGARWVGMVFFPPSPRHVEPEQASAIANVLPPAVDAVGVMVNPDDEAVRIAVASGVGALQLHGGETPERIAAVRRIAGVPVIKALGISTRADARGAKTFSEAADMILFDARPPDDATRPGGNARAFDWPVLMGLDLPLPWILSGGLTPTNVGAAIASSGATAVDVSSGIERSLGEKDDSLIINFLAAVRAPVDRSAPVLQ